MHINTLQKVYEFLIKIYSCLKLKKSIVVINSMIFFHKYYLYNLFNNTINNNINNKDFSLLCISCFLIGIKSSDIYIRIDDMLYYIYKNNIIINDNKKEAHKKLIFYYEYEVLESLGFDITSYHIPNKLISDIFGKINNKIQIEKDENKQKKIKEYIIANIRYSFVFPIFLKFNMPTIVLSCIIIILKKFLKNFDIGQIINEFKEENFIQSEIDYFCELFNFFLVPKTNNDIIDKNEINDNKSINMDIIKKINLSNNADSLQYCPSNNFTETKTKGNV